MTFPDWQSWADRDFEPPPGTDLRALWPEVLGAFAQTDPDTRLQLAFPALATWTEAGQLDQDLAEVGKQSAELLSSPDIHVRSFTALLLAEVIGRDLESRTLKAPTLRAWIRRWGSWYEGEEDLRSLTPEHGWLHALAHGADVGLYLALHPLLSRKDLLTVLEVYLRRLDTVQKLPAQFEEDRIALAVFALLTRSQLTAEDRQEWLTGLRKRWSAEYGQPRSVSAAFATQVGRALLLFTLLGAQLPGGLDLPPAPELQDPVLQALRDAFPAYLPAPAGDA